MNANRVLAVLEIYQKECDGVCPACGANERLRYPHSDKCPIAALLAEAEHEAQEPGGWKSGMEPPSDGRDVIACYWYKGKRRQHIDAFVDGAWQMELFGKTYQPVAWHDLPPLPGEEST